jgi:hypothetical protein
MFSDLECGPIGTESFHDLGPVVDARPITTLRYSVIVASMVKRRRTFSHLAYGSVMHRINHKAPIYRDTPEAFSGRAAVPRDAGGAVMPRRLL